MRRRLKKNDKNDKSNTNEKDENMSTPDETPKAETATALVTAADVDDLFDYQPPAVPLPEVKVFDRVPRLGFKTDKGPSAAAIATALGNVPLATPYVEDTEGDYHKAAGCSIMQLAEFPYWAQRKYNGKFMENLRVYLLKPSKDDVPSGVKIDECILTIQVILPGVSGEELPEAIAPGVACVNTYANATSKVATQIAAGIEDAASPEFLKRNPELGQVKGVRKRVVGHLQANIRTSKAGWDYVTASAFVKPAALPQIRAFSEFMENGGAAQIATAKTKFDNEVKALVEIASKS